MKRTGPKEIVGGENRYRMRSRMTKGKKMENRRRICVNKRDLEEEGVRKKE